jgi:16S rRNA (uracil1498-N3)-methyltransferase
MTKETDHLLPRLYVDLPLALGAEVVLEENAAHYLKTVLRRPDGSLVRLFNGRDGEWRAALRFEGKKIVQALPEVQILPQPLAPARFASGVLPHQKRPHGVPN